MFFSKDRVFDQMEDEQKEQKEKQNNEPKEEWVLAGECNCPKAIADFEKSIGVRNFFFPWNCGILAKTWKLI